MAGKKENSYYKRRQIAEEVAGQPTYNIQQRFIEAYGGESEWDITVPKDVQYLGSDYEDVGSDLTTAPTTNPKRPRALTIGYNPNTNVLIVVFRDNTWWQYNNVPLDLWMGLKSSSSTGKYLRESGLDSWSDMGPAELDALSEGVKAQLSQSAESASNIQNSNTTLEKAIEGSLDKSILTPEDMYKDYL